jgi:phage/plasmid-associated DNA primase
VLFKDFKAWCESNGEYSGSAKAFSQRLQSHGFERDRNNRVRTFKGIVLCAVEQEPPASGDGRKRSTGDDDGDDDGDLPFAN